MKMRGSRRRALVLLAGICVAALLVSGCNGSAFESSDYFITFLTSQPTGKQISNTSGRARDEIASAVLRARVAAYTTRLADESYDQAMELYGNGDFDLAGDLLDESIHQRPNDIRYRTDRAKIALFAGDTDVALVNWEEQDRIARLNGFDMTDGYWARSVGEVAGLVLELSEGESTPKSDVQLSAAYYRYADTLDGQADYTEAVGPDPDSFGNEEEFKEATARLLAWTESQRQEAAEYRAKAEILSD